MSGTTSARRPLHRPLPPTSHPSSTTPAPPGAAPSRAEQKAQALGLTSATGLVIGSIIGTGVFTMPAVLAGAGTSSLLVLAVIAIGAMLLAVLFVQLT
jgi:basic amino acid/polyamine antiporter, APA family